MSSKNRPIVTVRISSYNHEEYVTEAIMSVVNQSYGFKNIQLIVIDDASTDKTGLIIDKLSKQYDFKFIQNTVNIGAAANNNRIIKMAKGKYIAGCASDDYWTNDKIKKQVEFMERNPEIPFCYGQMIKVDHNSKPINYKKNLVKKLFKIDERNTYKSGHVFNDIILMNFHPPVSGMFRTEIFNKVGYYDEELRAEDFDMNLKITRNYPIGYIDDVLGYYRIHRNHTMTINYDNVFNSHRKSIEKYRNDKIYSKAINFWRIRKALKISNVKQRKKEAIGLLLKAKRFFFKREYIYSLLRILFH